MDREPQHPEAYAEALAAADGDKVIPIVGAEASPNMVLWHNSQWMPVLYRSPAGGAIRIDFEVDEPGGTAFRFTNPDTELYRRVPAGRAVGIGTHSTQRLTQAISRDGTAPQR